MNEYTESAHQFQDEEGFPYIYAADAETYYQLMNEEDRAYI